MRTAPRKSCGGWRSGCARIGRSCFGNANTNPTGFRTAEAAALTRGKGIRMHASAQRLSRSRVDAAASSRRAAISDTRSPREPSPTHQPHRLASIAITPAILQPKLMVGEVDDPAEHEADVIAARVMRMPAPIAPVSPMPLGLHRKCAACEEEELSRAPAPGTRSDPSGSAAPSIVHDVLRAPAPHLDSATRQFFEGRFGHDFGTVRVHTDARAAASARA